MTAREQTPMRAETMVPADGMPAALEGLGLVLEGPARYLAAAGCAFRMWRSYRRAAAGCDSAVRLRLHSAHHENAQRLAVLCRANGAVWVKLAQFLSCRPDLMPPEYVEPLATLQNDADSVPLAVLEPVLSASWGRDWRARFASFDPVPVATGSVGQVHRARLADGRDVAVKIRLPAALRQFRQDFVMLRLLARVVALRVRQVDVRQVVRELLRATAEELDFAGEKENIERFATYPGLAGVRTPLVVAELSGSAVLVTGWVHGRRLTDVLREDRGRAPALLRVLMDSYLLQITRNGFYHVDPHPGNFLVDEANCIWMLDFGAVGRLAPEQAHAYLRLLARLLNLTQEDLGAVLAAAGFSGSDPRVVQALSGFFIGTGSAARPAADQLQTMLVALQRQPVRIPDSFVLMMRVLITLGGFMQLYGVRFNLLAVIGPLLRSPQGKPAPMTGSIP